MIPDVSVAAQPNAEDGKTPPLSAGFVNKATDESTSIVFCVPSIQTSSKDWLLVEDELGGYTVTPAKNMITI